MVAECPELFSRCLGDGVYGSQLAFAETHPTSCPYGGTMKDVYPPKTVERVLEKYGELMASVLETATKYKVKVLLGSKGIVTDLARLLGGKAKFEALRKRHGQLFVNIHSDRRKFRTMFHPECVTNPRCLTHIYKFICEQLNLAMTALLVYLTGDEMAECTFGNELYEHISGTGTFLFLV